VTLALAEPLTAFALAVLVVNEQPAAGAFAGLGLVLAGLAVVIWAEVRKLPKSTAADLPLTGSARPESR
jgi:DME family drug/metabolite transporter